MRKIGTFKLAFLTMTLLLTGCDSSSSDGSSGGDGGGSGDVAGWKGTRQLGVAGASTLGKSVATDTIGNVYVAGYTGGGLDGNTLTGSNDFFVTQYDSNGVRQYTRQLGVAWASTLGMSVATDTIGNVYVTGYTNGGLDGNTRTGNTDFFVTKYDNNGVRQYTRQQGTPGASYYGRSVATDAGGNVYVVGETNDGMGNINMFITQYDSTGTRQYSWQLGVAGAGTNGRSVTTDINGNVYVAGYTSGGLDGNTLMGTTDFFVTKYDGNGVRQYTRQLGVAGATTYGRSVATDVDGNVYVAGYTNGGLDGNTLMGNKDFFVTKYDSNGNKQYTRQLGKAGAWTSGQSVATDSDGNIYVVGETSGVLNGSTLAAGTSDFFVTKYDSNGDKQYTRQLGVTGASTLGQSVATDTDGNVYVAGYTYGELDGNTLTGSTDFFVTKYDSSGVKQ